MSEAIPKRSVIVGGMRTSVSLEEPFWTQLKRMAKSQGLSINDLVTRVDALRFEATGTARTNLSSALRIAVLDDLLVMAGFKPSEVPGTPQPPR